MTKLLAATIEVSLDEPAFSLVERNLLSPDSRSLRRYQIILVVRGDRLAEYREDMGPAESFAADELGVTGGVIQEGTGRCEIVHTVGEVREIADMLRDGRLSIEVEPAPLWPRFFDELDVAQRERARISAYGPLVKVERN